MRKEAQEGPVRPHTLTMEDRQRVQITGVEDVDSFNEEMIVLLTSVGAMTLIGEGLHIGQLNLEHGVLSIEGQIMALEYDEKSRAARSNVLGRLFK